MATRSSMRIVVLIATLAAIAAVAVAQTQAQGQQNQNQNQTQQTQNQNQNQQQNQQAQPQQKKSFWQKMKESAMQGTQNTVQQGTNAAQSTVQQGTTAVQNGVQQVQNGAQQGVQQGAQGAFPANQESGAFSGGGAGAGSCGPSCFDAGPFQANVLQMTMSQQGYWHVIRMNVQFHNSTNQPLAIGYREGSMVMVDNNGNTYIPAGGSPGELQGMGIDRGNQTDSSFVLGPGQTGNALFSVARQRGNDSAVGTGYTYNLTIDELQAQNGAMAIPVRQYNLNFPSLAPGVSSTAAFPSGFSPAKGFAGGGTGTGTSYAGAAVSQGTAQAAPGQRGVAAPAQQRRMVSGKPAMPAAAVNNASMKTATTTTTVSPSAAVKPIPVVTTTKTTTPPKKTTTATTTTSNTTNK
jgi:hypothetical protein